MDIVNPHPLLSPQPFGDYDPKSYRDYVKNLKATYMARQEKIKESKAKAPTGPVPGINFRYNAKGTPILTVRRKPKWITKDEIVKLHQHYDVPSNILWTLIRTKGIELSTTKIQLTLT